jgi:hypothetical protein
LPFFFSQDSVKRAKAIQRDLEEIEILHNRDSLNEWLERQFQNCDKKYLLLRAEDVPKAKTSVATLRRELSLYFIDKNVQVLMCSFKQCFFINFIFSSGESYMQR